MVFLCGFHIETDFFGSFCGVDRHELALGHTFLSKRGRSPPMSELEPTVNFLTLAPKFILVYSLKTKCITQNNQLSCTSLA
jgi:hypothetical protein